MYATTNDTCDLITVDMSNGSCTTIGSLDSPNSGSGFLAPDITFVGNTLYGVSMSSRQLAVIDTESKGACVWRLIERRTD